MRRPANDRFAAFERSVFSQNGEDGVLEHLVAELGIGCGLAVEIGAADGEQNCTRNLVESGWSALWIEGDPELTERAARLVPQERVTVLTAMVDARSIVDLVQRVDLPEEFDLLVLDVDGPDLGIMESILASYRPTIVVHEYNGEHGGPWECHRAGGWDYDWNYGASLESFGAVFGSAGYSLIGCESQGVNAFWVRSDRMGGALESGQVSELKVSPRHRAGSVGHPRRSPYRLLPTDPIGVDELDLIRFRSFELLTAEAPVAGASVIVLGDVHNGMMRPASTELAPVEGSSFPIFLSYAIVDADGREVEGERLRTPMNAVIPAGGTRPMAIEVRLPDRSGAFRILPRVVQEGVAWGGYVLDESVPVLLP